MKALTATVLAAACSLSAMAEIEWLQEKIDFGTFHEANGPKTGSVRFVNRGPEPTIITRVRPSCGCTGETHTEDVIEPGDTATISVTYNPIGRPGRFEKTVRVYTGEREDVKTIPITGTVIGTSETLRMDYPVEAGALRLSDTRIKCGDIVYGTARHHFLKGYNQSDRPIRPTFESGDDALSIDISTQEVLPGDVVSFSLYFNTRDLREPGPIEIPIKLKAGNDSTAEATVIFEANVIPDVRNVSPQGVADGPRLYAKPDLVDVGYIKGDKEFTREFAIFNHGKSELQIKRIYSHSEAITTPKYPVRLKAGQSGKATLHIDPKLLPEGPASVNIDIYSNDPIHPITTVKVALNKE